jgi:hypothetical protein
MTTEQQTVPDQGGSTPAPQDTHFWNRPENIVQPGEAHWDDEDEGDDGEDDFPENGPGQETPAEPQTAESKSTETQNQPDLSDVKDADVRKLMVEEASKRKLNLDDPRDREIARSLAEAQNQIRILRLKADPSAPAQSYLKGVLSKFDEKPEKDQSAEPQKDQAAATPNPNAEAPNLPDFMKVAQNWQQPTDFSEDLLSAYESQDKKRISDVYMGFVHRMIQDYVPILHQQITETVNQRLGPLAQEAEVLQSFEVNNQVIGVLKSDPSFADIEKIFENASSGKVELNGEQVPDTWLNRILSRNPMIELIQVEGKTKAESDRKTRAARYAAIYEEYQRMQGGPIDPNQAKKLVDAGRAAAQTRRDPVRQSLNAGRTGVPTGAKPTGKFRDIVSYNDGAMSVNDLFE